MATDKQNAANDQNAQLSSGPKTQEGKDVSRRNAMKYGITGLGIIRPEHLETETLETIDWIWPHFKPRTHYEERLVKGVAFHLIGFEEAGRLMIGRRCQIGLRAAVSWDQDQLLLASDWWEDLAKKPTAGARRLKSKKHGCIVLIEQWTALDGLLDHAADWDAAQRSMALDMLGVSHAVRTGPTVLDAPADTEARTHLRGVVRQEIEALEARRDELEDVAETERHLALEGHDPNDQELRKLRRYANENLNKVLSLQREFARVDRKGLPWVPPTKPRRYEGETDEDYHGRLTAFLAEIKLHDERARQEANATRLTSIAEETRALMEDQPRWHEGLDFAVYLERLQEWRDKKSGKKVKAVVIPEKEDPPIHDASMTEALPVPPEPEQGPRPEWPEPVAPVAPLVEVAPQPAYDRQDR